MDDGGANYNLSFSGCGFLCIYHTGVIAAIKEYAPQLGRNRVCGASAGAIAAAGLVCNVCISEAVSIILSVVTQARKSSLGPFSPDFHLMELVRLGLEQSLPENAHELCTNKLAISLTRYNDGENVIIEDFNTREELIQAILCSCYIPGYCGWNPPRFRGEQYMDGGWTDNQPIVDSRTITVSPFSGEADICPPDFDSASMFGFEFSGTSIRFTAQNLFRVLGCLYPVSQENCSRICRQGFEDALRFLTKNGLTPCAKCLTVQSSALPLPKYHKSATVAKARNSSSTSLGNRVRLNSECDMCFEKVEPKISSGVTTLLFPSIVQQKLDEATTAEHWLLDKLYKYRVVRYACRVTYLPVAVAIEYALFGLRSAAAWIASLPYLNAATRRFQEMILFISSELKRIYGSIVGISCFFPISTINSKLPSNSQKLIQNYERVPPLTDINVVSPHGNVSFTYEEDSLSEVVHYCKQHDAILAYYYQDDNNQTQICEIFDINNPRRVNSCHSTNGTSKRAVDLPPLIQEQENENLENYLTTGNAEDSGLSLTEDNAVSNAVNKRDACCSPVRQLALNRSIRGNVSRRSGGYRRTGAKISNTIPDSRCSAENDLRITGSNDSAPTTSLSNNVFSSDSDPDAGGEMLFVTSRRKRTATNDYDGDPEQSDTDRGC